MATIAPRRRRRRVEWNDLEPIGIGVELTAARELLGLPIETVAAETRIRASYLIALEEEHFSRLPGGVAGRGLLRTYATYLGLDAVELLSALESHGRLPIEPETVELAPRRPPPSRSLLPRLAGLAAAVTCVLGLVYFLYSQYSVYVAAEAAGTQRATVSSRGDVATAVVPPTATVPSVSATPTQRVARQASLAALLASAPSPTAIPPTATVVRRVMAPLPSPTPLPASPTPVELVVEARLSASTRARVEVDGQLVSDGIISAGDQRTWRGSSVKVQVDDASAVEISVNGRPAAKLGSSGQARTVTWSR